MELYKCVHCGATFERYGGQVACPKCESASRTGGGIALLIVGIVLGLIALGIWLFVRWLDESLSHMGYM